MLSDLTPPGGDARFNRWLAGLVLTSALLSVAVIVVLLGIRETPWDSTDSQGRPMGFNDPLSAEHFVIIARHFRAAQFLTLERAYEWLLLAMHPAGACLLLCGRRASLRLVRGFFAVQAIIFPLGLAFCWAAPLLLVSVFTMAECREGLTDIPLTFSMGCTAHSVWVFFSLFIVFALRPRVGFRRLLSHRLHAAGQAFFRITRVAR
jgi:hypothetical protein